MLSELQYKLGKKDLEQLKAIMKIQTVAFKAIHDHFAEYDFLQLMPVILSKFTDPVTDGDKPKLTPGMIDYEGQLLKLTQSMILHKQLAIGSGLDKFYIMSPNVRLEPAEARFTGQHLIEFTQVDFEIANAKMEDMFAFIEDLMYRIKHSIERIASNELITLKRRKMSWEKKFPVYTSHEILDRYGEDWEFEASRTHSTPFWVTCIDRHFYDKVDRRNGELHFKNYELIYPDGFGAALSGSEREYDFVNLVNRMVELNLSRYEYAEYLIRAQSGLLAPSAGAGLGFERLIRYLTGMREIGDIQLFRRVPGEELTL